MLSLLTFIDWQSFLLGSETWPFLLETAVRTFAMFLVIVLSLRLLGKRGIKQLSVFELGVIIGLGSAAGDPMFHKDVGLLSGIIVFGIILSLYSLITHLINTYNGLEQFLEGKPTCIVDSGCFLIQNFKKEPIARDEFFSQLRLNSVTHLGQVQQAILETNGEVSIFYYRDEDVLYGLPVLPNLCDIKLQNIDQEGIYACAVCGNTEKLLPAQQHTCQQCRKSDWVKAINWKRIR
jgi:uncharacterized membrane protein YcaP (DUF421 family)